jgi:HEAT repeat protein
LLVAAIAAGAIVTGRLVIDTSNTGVEVPGSPGTSTETPEATRAPEDEKRPTHDAAPETPVGARSEEAIVPALIQALGDKNENVRQAAAVALGEIGPEAKEAVPALTQMLEDEDKDVRQYTVEALREIGPEAKEAVPALIQVLIDR